MNKNLINILTLVAASPFVLVILAMVTVFFAAIVAVLCTAWIFGAKIRATENGKQIGYYRWFTFYPG